MTELSIILPVYNGAAKIQKCVESICNQTQENIELLIIDDGSKDDSSEVIQGIIEAEKEKNIQISFLSQENQGVAVTRNKGMDMAKGEYILFMDQDDFLAPEYCYTLLEKIKSQKTDIVVAGYIRVDEEGNELYHQELREDDWSPYVVMAPWAHIYRRAFLQENQIRFLSTGIGEDVYFNMMAYAYTQKIGVTSYKGYFWTDNPKSVSNTNQVSISEKSNPFILLEELQKDMPKKEGQTGIFQEYFFVRYIVWYLLYTLPGSQWKDVVDMQNRLFKWLAQNYPSYGKNPNISFRKPRGDSMMNRWSVWVCVRAKQMGMIKPVLKILSKIL